MTDPAGHAIDHLDVGRRPARALGSGSADIPDRASRVDADAADPSRRPKKPRILKRAVVFRPRCSELCHVRSAAARIRRVSVTDTFAGRRAIRVPKPAGHGRLHWSLVARDEAGNRSRVTSGRL